jgi:hypothetical protein
MTWALFSTMEDMAAIAAGFKEDGLSGPLRVKLRGYWNGGLSDWQTAPCIPADHPCWDSDGVASMPPREVWVSDESDAGGHWETITSTCMRMIVCTFGTVADFQSLLRELIGNTPEADYYTFIEPFITQTGWYAAETPIPAGYFDGMIC